MEQNREAFRNLAGTPYQMRVPSHNTTLHQVPPSPEEQIIRQRRQRQLQQLEFARNQRQLQQLEFARKAAFVLYNDDDKVLRRTLKAHKKERKRLMMSRQQAKDKASRKKAMKEWAQQARLNEQPRLWGTIVLPCNLKEFLKPYHYKEVVKILDLWCGGEDVRKSMRCQVEELGGVKQMIKKLHVLRRNILRHIPSRMARFLGSRRDTHCYKRVRPQLEEFKEACFSNSRILLATHEWDLLLSYIASACQVVAELPEWEDYSNNRESSHKCMVTLAAHCMIALKHSNLTSAQYVYHRYNLQKALDVNKEIGPCITYINKRVENNDFKEETSYEEGVISLGQSYYPKVKDDDDIDPSIPSYAYQLYTSENRPKSLPKNRCSNDTNESLDNTTLEEEASHEEGMSALGKTSFDYQDDNNNSYNYDLSRPDAYFPFTDQKRSKSSAKISHLPCRHIPVLHDVSRSARPTPKRVTVTVPLSHIEVLPME